MTTIDLASQILLRIRVPVWVVDARGEVAFVNDAATGVLGYRDPATLLGRPGHETVHHHRPDGSAYPVAECPVLRPRRPHTAGPAVEEWFIRRDGSSFPITWTSAPISLPDGQGAVVSFHDVSEERAHRRAVDARPLSELTERAPASAPGRRAALLEEVRAFAVANAADPSLCPERLARRHGMSLRALQVLFAENSESPARVIREVRLDHARRLLVSGRLVTAAARESGFSDVRTFSRAFRRRFGVPPGAVRA
ncbi:helix-turn-helix domain-containing protein [Kineococcus sp. R8]|uniref:helix-turn-helix domain-containing protein n=1 Tax=Kineococcus siccus TaxID=2696567 RepID=UPI001412692B|nr:helix-turn-helix domain-containing protein [Kineococcus siccus]NAZ83185.1 helix-turn-helix domain-containing protein [Kineococcus siccus]